MADEKIIKIVAQVDGNSGVSPEQEARAKADAANRAFIAQQNAARANARSLLGPHTLATLQAQAGQGGGTGGRRGRAPWNPNGNVPPPPPRGRAGPPPVANQPGASSAVPSASKIGKAWAIFQKGIVAVNGANGHLTKSVAFTTRTFQYVKDTLEELRNAGITVSGALQAVRGSASGVASKLGLSAAAASKVAAAAGLAVTSLGAAGLAAAGLTVQLGVTVGALKVLTRVTEGMQEVVQNFSGALNAARALTKMSEIQTRLRSANQVGGELASLEFSKSSAINAIIETKTELVDLFSPVIKAALTFFTNFLDGLNAILTVLNFISNLIETSVEAILSLLTYIPGLGKVAQKALTIMQQDNINNTKASSELHQKVQDLFMPEAMGFTKDSKKKSVAGRFLP